MKVLVVPLKKCEYASDGIDCDEREHWCSSSMSAGTYCVGDDHYIDLEDSTVEEREA